MAASPGSGETYVFSRDAVLRAITSLVSQPVHEHFPGYLTILQSLRKGDDDVVRSAEINTFHDRYMRVDGDAKAPYVSPFRSRGHGKLVRLNSNVAGSYAPKSLREGRLGAVINVEEFGQGATYSLRDDHAALVSERLLRGSKVPALALAAFLFRDYGFQLEAREVTRALAVFRDSFGLRADVKEEASTFDLLFRDDSHEFADGDLRALQEEGV